MAVPTECEVIQLPRTSASSNTPLILIHDGGGTTFAYHCLESLSRPVYGIGNPHFHSGAPWPGGLDEMADMYASMIRRTVSSLDFPWGKAQLHQDPGNVASKRRDILLGGWSLGGLLSLRIAWLLADDPVIHVRGIVMIDTVCFLSKPDDASAPRTSKVVGTMWDGDEPVRKNEQLARRAMKSASEMVRRWTLPTWDWGSNPIQSSPNSSTDGGRKEQDPCRKITTSQLPTCPCLLPPGPPPTILIKATGHVPMKKENEICPIDLNRQEVDLGWARYHTSFVSKVLDIDGNHFDIFGWNRVPKTTQRIRDACCWLDEAGAY